MARGTGDKIKGKANEIAGAVTNDRKREMKGKGQQAKGGVSDKLEEKSEEMKENEDPDDA